MAVALLALTCLASRALAYDYGFDPAKVQQAGFYWELAQDPVYHPVGGTYEYIVDYYDDGYTVSATTNELWGFENNNIVNMDTNVDWLGGSSDRIVMQCRDWFAVTGKTMRPPSWDPNSDDVWDLTGETWAIDNPWHLPSEYVVGMFTFHTDTVYDSGDTYNARVITEDMIPVNNFWLTSNPSGLVFTVRILSTDEYKLGDITWTPADNQNPMNVLGRWPGGGDSKWDFDGDGDIDAEDAKILCQNMGGDPGTYDVNNDGSVDAADLVELVENYVYWSDGVNDGYGTVMGDFNLDGVVNATDLGILSTNYGQAAPPAGWGWIDGNANCDNFINATDLGILSTYFGQSAPTTASPIPEPATISLLGLGAVAAAWKKKRR